MNPQTPASKAERHPLATEALTGCLGENRTHFSWYINSATRRWCKVMVSNHPPLGFNQMLARTFHEGGPCAKNSSQYLNSLSRLLGHLASVRFVLFGFRKNRASYSSRFPLIHSYGYASDKRSHRLLSPIFPEARTLHELSGLTRLS